MRGVRPLAPTEPTLREVAERAGVSVATASRALRGAANVSQLTVKRVTQAAREVGYQINHKTQSQARPVVALLLSERVMEGYADPFYSDILLAAQQELTRRGLVTELHRLTNPDDPTARSYVTSFVRSGGRGVLLVGADITPETVASFQALGLAVILVDNDFDDLPVSAVMSDNFNAIRRAVDYLIERGHRRLAFVGGPITDRSFDERLKGFRSAVDAAGLEGLFLTWTERFYTGSSEAEAFVRERLDLLSSCDGIFACNDILAGQLIQQLTQAGLRIPDDLSLIGFDDTILATNLSPPLTTVQVPRARMGRWAARLLLDQIEDPSLPAGVTLRLKCFLVERGSVRVR